MADKPIDDLKGSALADWQRGMLDRTIVSRFKLTVEALNWASDHRIPIDGMARCPECRGPMYPHKITLADKNVMFVPQCIANSAKDHGFGKWSKHGNQAPMGRKKGYKPPPKVTTSDPEPTPTPKALPAPVIPQGKVFHERFEDILRLYQAGERTFMLKGPAGSGKSTIGIHLAEHLNAKLSVVQGSGNIDEGELSYWRNPHDGSFKIAPGLQAATEGPSVYMIDEVDSIMPGNMIGLNMITANRFFMIDGKRHDIHPDAVFIMTGNAVNGGSRQYTGRFPVDAAVRDRCFEVFCDYSPAIDAVVCPVAEIRHEVEGIRKRVNNDPNLSKVFMPGARFLKRCHTASKAYGLNAKSAVRKVLDLSMDPDTAQAIVG